MADENTTAPAGTKARKPRAPSKPRPLFILYSVVDGPDGPDLDVKSATRKSDEILAALDADRSLRYKRVEV